MRTISAGQFKARCLCETALTTGAQLVPADRRLARHDPERVVW